MQRKLQHPRHSRRLCVETLEPRQMLSADPLGGALEHHTLPPPDFWLDPRDYEDIGQQFDEIEQLLSSAHNLTGWTEVKTDFGFRGGGQTVAVIDSGIAYDHWALGGGFGSNYRVVGGWDFTEENDANPFDDGPEGSHGTHVAGIIGNSSSTNSGVAPDVDLVALRVFNDAGQGYFSWVEKALKWVIDNRNAFENPITAINLSIGTSWNSTTVPNWSTLEDEFALLKAAGIFTAVSAGNDYTSYNAPGLSYPAASPYVVPVMSVDDNGSLSWYSQRHTSALAAPGRGIVSTVPDYAGNHNGVTDDFASKSGTSMAAPYVAGASVLIREAMQFVGYTNISQDTIYNHMRATAEAIGSTGYLRLNLANAIDALIPDDEYGSTVATAYNMGTVDGTMQLGGMINTLTDSDYFRFTAGVTGTISFTADLSHGQTASWLASGLNGWTSGTSDETYNIDVVAGQTYTLGLAASGLSHFTLNVTAESSLGEVSWGKVTQKQINNVRQSGEKLYRVETSRAGYLTAEAFYAGSGVTIAWLDATMQQTTGSTSIAGGQRAQVTASAGEQYYYLRVTSTSSDIDIDFRLTNLVSIAAEKTVDVYGSPASETFTFTAGTTQHTVTVNGAEYLFNTSDVNTINFVGGGDNDAITLTGTAGNETAEIHAGWAKLAGGGYTANVSDAGASDIENITIFGGGGNDAVTLYGTSGDDLYSVWWDRARMSGSGYFNEARFFNTTVAHAQGGFDRAHLYDTAGNDTYTAWSDRVLLTGTGFSHEASGFDRTIAKSAAGNDAAIFYDTTGNDIFSAWWNHAVMYGNGYFNDTAGFKATIAYSTSGADQAFLYDSAGDDLYEATFNQVAMSGNGFVNQANNFAKTYGFATVGNDRADFFDSAGNDTYTAWKDRVLMTGAGYANEACGFDRTKAVTSAGNDGATFYDSAGNDVFSAWWDHAVLYGNGFFNDTAGFDTTVAYASSGSDQAFLYDSAGNEYYTAWWNRVLMQGSGFASEAHNFDRTFGRATTGNDAATFIDSTGNDVYSSWPDHAVMYGPGYFNDTMGFDKTLAYSLYGQDQAFFSDSSGDDVFEAWSNRAVMRGTGYINDARGFRRATAYASNGFDQAILWDSAANDSVFIQAWGAYMTDGGLYHNEAHSFDRIEARRTQGGVDRAFPTAVDYVFALIGGWGA